MRRYIAILLAYLLLGLLLTWPMAAHLTTHVPGDGIDDPALAWNLWWVKHALVDQPQNPFISAWQFWPIGINLAFYTLTVLNGMLGVPLQAAFGAIPAYNLLLLSAFVLSGFGAFLLCVDFLGRADGVRGGAGTRGRGDAETRREGHREGGFAAPWPVYLAAFVGGALYAFASAKLFYAALGQGNIASSQWAPFAVLYMVRAARPQGRWRDAALAALFLVLQAYAELTYASFLAIFAVLLVACRLVPRRATSHIPHSTFHIRPLLARFALIGALFALGISPILANMLPDLRAEGDFLTAGGGFADLFSADLAGYTVPTQLHPLLGGLVRAWSNDSAPRADGSHFPVNKGQQIYLGYVALALAALGFWHGRRRSETWFWGASALLFFLLTLGPSLRIAGYDTGVPLPFRLVEQLPFFKGNRYPSRYSVMLLISAAPLVALGAWRVGRGVLRAAGRGAGVSKHRGDGSPGSTGVKHASTPLVCLSFGLLVALLLFEHLSVPLPLFDLRVPALYARVAAEPGDFALLELPPGWRNGARVAGKQDIVIMQELWNQTAHGKRVLGGNTSRNPEFKFQYFSEDPTLARLIAQTNAADLPQHDALRAALAAAPISAADRARAQEWAAFLQLRYVMVHRDKLPPATEEALRDLLPVTLVGEEGNLALYRVTAPAARPQTFAVGADSGRMILAEGWSPPGLGGGTAVSHNQGLPAGSSTPPVYAQRAEARLLLPLGPEAGQIRLRASALAPDQQVTLAVDGRAAGSQALPESPTWLAFDVPADPARPPLSDVRVHFSQLAPVAALARGQDRAGPSALLVRSAGQETGDFTHIYVDGVERSPNGRGYNLVALQPDGRFLGAAAFDTHADPAASARLAGWVAALPAGAVVAGAVRDEASMNLGQEAVDALRALGVAEDLRGRFRWGHAFIGRTGDPPGTALEALDGLRPAQVSRGLPLSADAVAAALYEVALR